MDTRSSTLALVAVLVFSMALFYPALAAAFSSYGGDFNLPIPASDQPEAEQGKGRMDDAIINVPDHLIINDIDAEITLTPTSDFDLSIFPQNPAGTFNSLQIIITAPEPATMVLLMLGAACLIILRPRR